MLVTCSLCFRCSSVEDDASRRHELRFLSYKRFKKKNPPFSFCLVFPFPAWWCRVHCCFGAKSSAPVFIVKCSLITLPAPAPALPRVKGGVRPSSVSVDGETPRSTWLSESSLQTARKTTATKSVHPEAAFRRGGRASWPIDARDRKKASMLLSSRGPRRGPQGEWGGIP